MSQISAATVNELRKRTDMPLMDCKSALQEAAGNMEKAIEILRSRNSKVQAKRALNETAEGRIAIVIDSAKQIAGIVDLRCESAPVTKSDMFIALGNDLARQVIEKDPKTVAELLAQPFVINPAITVNDRINEVIGLIRENMKVYRFARLAGGVFGEYVHHDGTVGALIQATGTPTGVHLREVAMHVAAVTPTPVATVRDEIPADMVAKEKEFAKTKAQATGKPANITDMIVESQMKTWFGENVLVEQPFVKDPSKTVGDHAKSGGVQVQKFIRYKVGEVVVE